MLLGRVGWTHFGPSTPGKFALGWINLPVCSNLLALIAMSACGVAQTLSPGPWINTGQSSATVTQGPLSGPLAVDSSGDLLAANGLVGLSAPTKILGATSPSSSVSKLNASGVPVFAVQIGGAYSIYLIAPDSGGNVLIAGNGPAAGGLPVTPQRLQLLAIGPQCRVRLQAKWH